MQLTHDHVSGLVVPEVGPVVLRDPAEGAADRAADAFQQGGQEAVRAAEEAAVRAGRRGGGGGGGGRGGMFGRRRTHRQDAQQQQQQQGCGPRERAVRRAVSILYCTDSHTEQAGRQVT